MNTREFGATGVNIPIIGQGTWQMTPAGLDALRAGIALGMTHIDSAEMYTGAEQVIAEAIRGRREEIFLVSKVLPSNASYKGTLRACESAAIRWAAHGKVLPDHATNFATRIGRACAKCFR